MEAILFFSDFAIPFVVLYIVAAGLLAKCSVYDVFVEGAQKGIKTVIGILPTLVGLLIAVNVLRMSGFMETLAEWLTPVAGFVHIPEMVVPLILVKMFSSSAATGILLDLYRTYGTDSVVGLMSSIICSSTETIFYTMSVYFMVINIKKTRWTLPGALAASLSGVICSIGLTFCLF